MEMLQQTLNYVECMLIKCNKEYKAFIDTDIYIKYKEGYNNMETNADRKKLIKLVLPNEKYLNLIKCKYNNCHTNTNKIVTIIIKLIPFFEKILKIKTPADVVKSIAIVNDPKNTKISFEIYIKNVLFHYLNIMLYSQLLIIKTKKLQK